MLVPGLESVYARLGDAKHLAADRYQGSRMLAAIAQCFCSSVIHDTASWLHHPLASRIGAKTVRRSALPHPCRTTDGSSNTQGGLDHEGHLSGFSIDLWNDIASRLNRKTDYQFTPDVTELLEAVRNDKADLGISAVSITADREAIFDFSQPIMNAGLQILVRGGGEGGVPQSADRTHAIVFLTHDPGLVRRRAAADLIRPSRSGCSNDGTGTAVVPDERSTSRVSSTPCSGPPAHWQRKLTRCRGTECPRIVAVLWMFTAVVFVAFYTAQLTAALTVQRDSGAPSTDRTI